MKPNDDEILHYVQAHGPVAKYEILTALGIPFSRADAALRRLHKQGNVELIRGARRRYYKWRANPILETARPE